MPDFTEPELERVLGTSRVWARGFRGEGVTVAVIDSGVTPDPDLARRIVESVDFSGDETTGGGAGSHATKVARLVLAIAPEAHIANLKVFSSDPKKSSDRGTVIRAVEHCVAVYPRYRVLNMSLAFRAAGFCTDERPCPLCIAVNEAVAKGIVVVAAAGNEGPAQGTITCPGRAEGAITVGASETQAQSDYWQSLNPLRRWWYCQTGQLAAIAGTSFSAPLCSGGAALLLSAWPETSPAAIKTAMAQSARPLPGVPANAQGAGEVNFSKALTILIGPSDAQYQEDLRALYYLDGNADAQRPDNPFVTVPLDRALSYIEKALLWKRDVETVSNDLKAIKGYLVPGCLPSSERRIAALLASVAVMADSHDS